MSRCLEANERIDTRMDGWCLWSVFSSVVTLLVLASACVQLFHLARRLFIHAFAPYPPFTSYGAWAVVTGCTDGIGLGYAKELARHGMNIALISRNPDKLRTVACHIEKEFGVETRAIQADFTKLDIYEGIKEKLAGLDVGILVNNVGMTTELSPFLDVPDGEKTYQDMLLVNNMSMVRMTHMVLPGMVEKRKGIVINISSIADVSPVPLLTIYSATKAFIYSFSRGLAYEYKKKGILIHHVDPWYVYTKMIHKFVRPPGLMVPTPDIFVRSDLRSITKVQDTSGYWFHNLLREVGRFGDYVAPTAATNLVGWVIKIDSERSIKKQAELEEKEADAKTSQPK
ncbi:unnamed protein product [Darwinula stevensoni]|uniref:Uncharacterized protein n=1 Tax=Darwinula stevensoni TaxID=69355 RepID=A0A7R9A8X6_9CRUS|nr:unnamed protein product [Darwinula stevensoni]CAG0896853.1 unnamed protein product [Darwinula stevensoni]